MLFAMFRYTEKCTNVLVFGVFIKKGYDWQRPLLQLLYRFYMECKWKKGPSESLLKLFDVIYKKNEKTVLYMMAE